MPLEMAEEHALRLGFFGEEMAASVKRVSVAERDRFGAQRVEARKDVGATGRHATIEITDELVARPARSRGSPR